MTVWKQPNAPVFHNALAKPAPRKAKAHTGEKSRARYRRRIAAGEAAPRAAQSILDRGREFYKP